MNIKKATREYEKWLGQHLTLIQADLVYKHERMSKSLFEFMRATFYRWAQLWFKHDLASAPKVLAVGDLHTDNFGSWRDVEGRLVWGINDFDEAYRLAYTNDLVRLAVSASISLAEVDGSIPSEEIAVPILDGYKAGLRSGGKPFVLAENNGWLSDLILPNLKDPESFWTKLEEHDSISKPMPESARLIIEETLPAPGLKFRTAHRRAGLGSLGRQRFLALMDYCRSLAAREAKELTVSACVWALGVTDPKAIDYATILSRAVRCPDPFLRVRGSWVVRRLSPDYTRIDLAEIAEQDRYSLLYAMGWETANVHLGAGENDIKKVREDLKKRDKDWLISGMETMQEQTEEDWYDWLNESLSEEDQTAGPEIE